jgi:hypothetical protein
MYSGKLTLVVLLTVIITSSSLIGISVMAIESSQLVYAQNTLLTHGAQNDNRTLFTEEPSIEQNFLWKGIISSEVSQVPGREDIQTTVILPPRIDGGVYSGIFTYQASRPVNVTLWNEIELSNDTAIPEEFGRIEDVVELAGRTIVLQEIESGTSGSIPFVGNAIELTADEPFIVTYGVNALTAAHRHTTEVSDTQSLLNSNASGMPILELVE